jgi:hypothetical protein
MFREGEEEIGAEKALAVVQSVPISDQTKRPNPAAFIAKSGKVYHLIDNTKGASASLKMEPANDTFTQIQLLGALVSKGSKNATKDEKSAPVTASVVPELNGTILAHAFHRTILAFGDSLTYGTDTIRCLPSLFFRLILNI